MKFRLVHGKHTSRDPADVAAMREHNKQPGIHQDAYHDAPLRTFTQGAILDAEDGSNECTMMLQDPVKFQRVLDEAQQRTVDLENAQLREENERLKELLKQFEEKPVIVESDE